MGTAITRTRTAENHLICGLKRFPDFFAESIDFSEIVVRLDNLDYPIYPNYQVARDPAGTADVPGGIRECRNKHWRWVETYNKR